MGRVTGTPRLDRDRKNPTKGNYYIYWTDDIEGSKELSTRTKDYAKALEFFNRWRLRSIGITTSRSIDEVLLGEILEYYRNDRFGSVKCIDRIDGAIKRLQPFWSQRPAATVCGLTCKDYESYRFDLHDELYPYKETISINTIRRELGVLRSALNKAYQVRMIDRSVFVDVPAEITKNIEFFKCADAVSLIRISKHVKRAKIHLPLFLKIGFATGRRKAAILELRWSNVDFEANIINWMSEGESETKKRRPIGAMPKRLRRTLLKHRKKHPDDEFVISYLGRGVKDIKSAFHAAVNLMRKEISLETGEHVDEILRMAYPHMMRHSCATWLMQKGVDKSGACQFLGMTQTTLDKRYWHHHPDYQREPADAF
jgi:integrase